MHSLKKEIGYGQKMDYYTLGVIPCRDGIVERVRQPAAGANPHANAYSAAHCIAKNVLSG